MSRVHEIASEYVRLRPEFHRSCAICGWDGNGDDPRPCPPSEACRVSMIVTALKIADAVEGHPL